MSVCTTPSRVSWDITSGSSLIFTGATDTQSLWKDWFSWMAKTDIIQSTSGKSLGVCIKIRNLWLKYRSLLNGLSLLEKVTCAACFVLLTCVLRVQNVSWFFFHLTGVELSMRIMVWFVVRAAEDMGTLYSAFIFYVLHCGHGYSEFSMIHELYILLSYSLPCSTCPMFYMFNGGTLCSPFSKIILVTWELYIRHDPYFLRLT
jgi:hypothetical protein